MRGTFCRCCGRRLGGGVGTGKYHDTDQCQCFDCLTRPNHCEICGAAIGDQRARDEHEAEGCDA